MGILFRSTLAYTIAGTEKCDLELALSGRRVPASVTDERPDRLSRPRLAVPQIGFGHRGKVARHDSEYPLRRIVDTAELRWLPEPATRQGRLGPSGVGAYLVSQRPVRQLSSCRRVISTPSVAACMLSRFASARANGPVSPASPVSRPSAGGGHGRDFLHSVHGSFGRRWRRPRGPTGHLPEDAIEICMVPGQGPYWPR